jgi:hypothetical protein
MESKKEVEMAEVYEKLRERLDMFPQGFPKTQSGVELEILKNLFTEEEAKIALSAVKNLK